MQRAKTFFYVSLGVLALATAFHLGARSARGQGGMARQLTSPPAFYHDFAPSFSPDGGRVAFVRIRENSTGGQVLVVDVLGGAETLLVPDLPQMGVDIGLEWSPDGNGLAVSAVGSEGRNAIWIADIGTGPVQSIETTWSHMKAERR